MISVPFLLRREGFAFLLLPAVFLCLAVRLFAQAATAPSPQLDRVRADLHYLTSPQLAGRVSLSPEADRAAHYLAQEFQKAGLQPAQGDSYLQAFPLVAYQSDLNSRALLLKRRGETHLMASPALLSGFYRDVDLVGPVVFAGYGITAPEYGYDDYARIDVKGKIVVLFDHEPQEKDPTSVFHGTGHTLHAGRWMKVDNARRHGALAVLIGPDSLNHPPSVTAPPRPPLRAGAPPQSMDDPSQIPAFSITTATLAEILQPIASSPGQVERSIDTTLQSASVALPDTTLAIKSSNAEQHRGVSLNIAGLLPGSDPVLSVETVLLTAHYDHLGIQQGHLYPGANDNASGTVAVLELVRLFQQTQVRPKRSILFVVFGSEEQLMLGSFYYTAHPLRPLATTRAVLNLDMIGRDEAHMAQDEGGLLIPANTTKLINVVGSFYSPDLRSALRASNQDIGLVLDTKHDADHTLNTLFRCDHLPFLLAHIPAVWLFGGFHPGYHEPSDTMDRLNYPKMAQVISLAYATATRVANTPTPPRFDTTGH
jgi:hypothetical protein